MIEHHVPALNGASTDYVLAGMTISLSSWELFFGFANPLLAGLGLFFGLILVIMRIQKQWKFRNEKGDG